MRARRPGIVVGLAASVSVIAVLGFLTERSLRGQGRTLAQQLAIQHYERAAWFALKAGKYEAIDPGLTREFRESAEWHYRRAGGYQRIAASDAAAESVGDVEHDRKDARLLERALKHDTIMIETSTTAADDAEVSSPP